MVHTKLNRRKCKINIGVQRSAQKLKQLYVIIENLKFISDSQFSIVWCPSMLQTNVGQLVHNILL